MSNKNRTKLDVFQLIRYAESMDSKVSENSRETLQGMLSQGEGISQLVKHYMENRSSLALELLCRVREPHDTELCNRIQDYLAKNALVALTLLGQVIHKAPSWLPKLAEHSIFDHILKFIRPSENIVLVVSSVLLVSSLLPHLVALKKSTLIHLFRLLIVACDMLYKFKRLLDKEKADIIEGIYVSHLYSAVTQYFIVLYGIYPANLVEYLRSHLNATDARALFVLETLFCAVKFHPNILKMTVEQELDRSRWSQREAHDFVAECRHMVVRPVLPMALKANKFILNNQNLDTSSSTISYVSQLPDLNSLFSTQTSSASSDALSASFDHWNEDNAWLEDGKSDLHCFLQSRSGSLGDRSTGVIISSSVESKIRRATADAAEFRHIRRTSFTQKINDFIRRRKMRTLSDEPLLHNRTFLRTLLDATNEDTFCDEPIEEIFVREDTQKPDDQGGQIEEGLDAREICSATVPFPLKQLPDDSFANTPATIVPLENVPQLECEILDDSETTTGLVPSSSCVTSTSAAKNYRQSVDFDSETADSVRFRKMVLTINGSEEPSGSISNDSANRFSVTSFFRKVNRQRFMSECTREQRGTIHFTGYQNNTAQIQPARALSCPHLLNSSGITGAKKIADLGDLKPNHSLATSNLELFVEEIEELIAQKCPYLPFLQALPFSALDEESLNVELSCEHERIRQKYIEASADYHTCLKQLGLSDCLPAKIHDDMVDRLKGLPSDVQIKVLNVRLALVNQHLLYERCGRLLHAERSRRLFGRLKQQKSSEIEKMSLSMALHDAHLEREQLINALTDLRKRINIERSKREEIEKKFYEEMKTSKIATDRYLVNLKSLKLQMKSLAEMNSHRQVELEIFKRRCEDAEMKLLFAESKMGKIGTLKAELKNAHQCNQQLRDEISLLQRRLEEGSSGPKSHITLMERDSVQLMVELMRLKNEVVRESNATKSAKAKAREFEDELILERRRCGEFSALLERAKKVHAQQCEAAQHKYLTLLSVCQKQQSHILDLYAKIEEIVALSHSKTSINIEPHTLFPNSSLSEMFYSSGSSQSSLFPSRLFEEDNSNGREASNMYTGDIAVSSPENLSKCGFASFSS